MSAGRGQPTGPIALPPLEPWLRNLLVGLFGLYVVELILRNVGVPVYALAWAPFDKGFSVWQPATRFVVQGDDSGAAFSVLVGLLVLYFMLPAVEQLMAWAQVRSAVVFGAVGGTAFALALDAVGLIPGGGTMGWTLAITSLIVLFGLAMPQGTVQLFFVLPVTGQVIVWGTLALSLVFFLLGRSLGTAEALGTWIGVYDWWHLLGPGARRRQLLNKASSIEKELRRFEVIEGGRDDPQGGQRDDWIHGVSLGPPGALELSGRPRDLDAFIRPAARAVQLGFGAVGALVLVWLEQWWLVPVPVAVAVAVFEYTFWKRGDRPMRLVLGPDSIEIADPRNDRAYAFSTAEIATAALHHRRTEAGRWEVVAALGSRTEPLLSVKFDLAAFEPTPVDIDADVGSVVVGGLASLVRALAPKDRVVRQPFTDPAGIAWLRAHLPRAAWTRTGLRLWRGEAPDLDLFGYHEGAPDAWLLVEGDTWTLTPASEGSLAPATGSVGGWRTRHAERTATLFRMAGEEHSEDTEPLPLLLLELSPDATIAIPAPIAGGLRPPEALSAELLHTHVPEGTALLLRLLRDTPQPDWPPVLREALQTARAHVDRLPPWLDPAGPERPTRAGSDTLPPSRRA